MGAQVPPVRFVLRSVNSRHQVRRNTFANTPTFTRGGNTLLINTPNLVIAAHLRKLNYDPLTSFEPICKLVNSPTVLAVNIASPYRSLADLLNMAGAHPGD